MNEWIQLAAKFCFSLMVLTSLSGCVTSETEKKETLERILQVDDGKELEVPDEPAPQAKAQAEEKEASGPKDKSQTVAVATPVPDSKPPTEVKPPAEVTPPTEVKAAEQRPAPAGIDLPPLATEPPGIGNRPAPNVVQPQTLKLPLPRGVVHSDIFQFLNTNADIVASYQPLSDEWKVFQNAFSTGQQASEDEVGGLRLRVRENLARTHWLFVWGLYQSSLSLLTPQKNLQLSMDRMQDFVERMNVLVFLMGEMKAGGMRADYKTYLRSYYKFANTKYFKRPMRNKEGKPDSPIAPTQPPSEQTDEGGTLNPVSKPAELDAQ
ncbi:MAG: hypothetical protein RIR26_429 [Pseudomonadota bacterium]|jgi:hypothetical protein